MIDFIVQGARSIEVKSKVGEAFTDFEFGNGKRGSSIEKVEEVVPSGNGRIGETGKERAEVGFPLRKPSKKKKSIHGF